MTLQDLLQHKDPKVVKRAVIITLLLNGLSKQIIGRIVRTTANYINVIANKYDPDNLSSLLTEKHKKLPILASEKMEIFLSWLNGFETINSKEVKAQIKNLEGRVIVRKTFASFMESCGYTCIQNNTSKGAIWQKIPK